MNTNLKKGQHPTKPGGNSPGQQPKPNPSPAPGNKRAMDQIARLPFAKY